MPSVTSARPLQRSFASPAFAPVLVVIALHTVVLAVIYWPTLRLAFQSDDWVYLLSLRTSLWTTLTVAIGYHYQPVACAWVALIRACFGENATAFQIVNLAQLGLLAQLAYQLGRRVLPDSGVAFFASLLVIGNSTFYETTYWPLAGNMHFLAADLYLMSVILACDVGRGRFGKWGPWLLCTTVLMAIFSHPAMVTSLIVCPLAMFILGDVDGETPAAARVRKIKALLPLAVVVVLFETSRLVFAAAIATSPQPAVDSVRFYLLVQRGVLGVFSLRGSHDTLQGFLTFGTNAGFGSHELPLYIAGWLAFAAAVAAITLWRTRTPGVRFLVCFLAVHVVIAAVGGGMSSRQSHVPSVPAALLTVWAFSAASRRLAAMIGSPWAATVCAQLPLAGVVLLIFGSLPDHMTSLDVHMRAANLSRTLFDRIRTNADAHNGPVNLTLVNMPAYTVERNIGAATFANGLHEMSVIASPKVASVEILRVEIPSVPVDFANGSLPADLDTVRARLKDPSRLVLLFQKPSTIAVLTENDAAGLGAR